jgi:hypothetical protein
LVWFGVIVFNATFYNFSVISWQSILYLHDTFVNIIFENAILRYVYIYVVLYISSEVIQLSYDASIIINMYMNTVPADDIFQSFDFERT